MVKAKESKKKNRKYEIGIKLKFILRYFRFTNHLNLNLRKKKKINLNFIEICKNCEH